MTHWFLEFRTVFPSWVLGVIAFLLAGGTYWLCHRRPASWRLSALRILATLGLFLEIAMVTLVERHAFVPGVCVLLDDSKSMQLPASDNERGPIHSRFASARPFSDALIDELKVLGVQGKKVLLSDLCGKVAYKDVPKTAVEQETRIFCEPSGRMKSLKLGDFWDIHATQTEAKKTGSTCRHEFLERPYNSKEPEIDCNFPVSPLKSAVETASRYSFWSKKELTRLSGIVLLTDGICTENVGAENSILNQDGCAVFPAVFGGKEPIPQVWVKWQNESEVTSQAIHCGEEVILSFRLFGQDLNAKTESATRTIRRLNTKISCTNNIDNRLPDNTGNTGNNTVTIEECVVFPASEGAFDLQFSWVPKVEGKHTVKIECDFPDANNMYTIHTPLELTLNVTDGVRKVLLITGTPDWEFRFLRNLLARETSIHLETWSPHGLPLALDATQDIYQRDTFPAEEELRKFDVVILNSIAPIDLSIDNNRLLNELFLENETKRHQRGLLVIAGRNFQPEKWERAELASLFPFSFHDMVWNTSENLEAMELSPMLHDILLSTSKTPENRTILPIFSFWHLKKTLPGAQILLETNSDHVPIIIQKRMEAGNVLFHATDNLWRWRRENEALYRNYWVQIIHNLCRNETIDSTNLENTGDSEKNATKLKIDECKKFDTKIVHDIEIMCTKPNREHMEHFASQTGGLFFNGDMATVSEVAQEIALTLRANEMLKPTKTQEIRYPIWRYAYFWFPILCLFIFFWIHERLQLKW